MYIAINISHPNSKGVHPLYFKIDEDIITKFKWHGFPIIKFNRKKFDGGGTTPSHFPALMNIAIFGHSSQYKSKEYRIDKNYDLILKVL